MCAARAVRTMTAYDSRMIGVLFRHEREGTPLMVKGVPHWVRVAGQLTVNGETREVTVDLYKDPLPVRVTSF
jgi:hypothetical protein